jgi:ubiquinone/menaquinone biosynthesis C-methylase UbiE
MAASMRRRLRIGPATLAEGVSSMPDQQSKWKADAVAAVFLEDIRGAIPAAALQIELIGQIVRAWCPRPGRILDLGCGDGVLGRYLLDRHPEAHVVFADFSDPMLAAARKLLGATEQATVVKADVSSPAWLCAMEGQAPFDVVVSGFVIHHLPDSRKQALYGEVFGLLGPGGVFLNLEEVASPSPAVETLHHDYFIDCIHAYQSKTGKSRSRDEIARAYADRPTRDENLLAPVDDQCRWLRSLGFTDVDCFFKLFEMAIFGGRKPAG